MSNAAGIHVQTGSNDADSVNSLEALKKTADDALARYLASIATPFQRERYTRFFADLEKAQHAYINFPDPATPAYIKQLEALMDKSRIHRTPRLNGSRPYVLDEAGELEIGETFAQLKKGKTLTEEKAFALAMEIYLNPNARRGVGVTGTPAEQTMLIAALDKVMALNPGAHKIEILNRPAPQPAAGPQATPQPTMRGNNSRQHTPAGDGIGLQQPVNTQPPIFSSQPPKMDASGVHPMGASMQEPSKASTASSVPSATACNSPDGHNDRNIDYLKQQPFFQDLAKREAARKNDFRTHFHSDPEIANKIWEDIKTRAQNDGPRLVEPQPDTRIEDDAEREEKYQADLKEYRDDVKAYWDQNEPLHAEILKKAGAAIPMPDETKKAAAQPAAQPAADNDPLADISNEELFKEFGDILADTATPEPKSSEAPVAEEPKIKRAAAASFSKDAIRSAATPSAQMDAKEAFTPSASAKPKKSSTPRGVRAARKADAESTPADTANNDLHIKTGHGASTININISIRPA